MITFNTPKGPGKGQGMDRNTIKGVAGPNGEFSAQGSTSRYCHYVAWGDGYYTSGDMYTFTKRSFLNRWKPWNPTVEVKLKEARNPVPMYAKRTQFIKVPILDMPVGYDLEKGDWVTPYGKGTVSDFVFNCHIRYVNNDDWDSSFNLTFTSEDDGIQAYTPPEDDFSSFRWPYEAPEEGYQKDLTRSGFWHPDGKHKPEYGSKQRYIFRVRTKRDEAGKITEARYGKMPDDIVFSRSGKISFTYYFNPSDNRSLEYDTERSLFKWPHNRMARQHKVTVP